MDEAESNGVFLHSTNLDSEFIVKCLTMLMNNFPGIKLTSVTTDDIHRGCKVHFSSPDKDVVLAKKCLIESRSGEEIRICPLTTSLTIHNVLKIGGEQLMEDLREAIHTKFGHFPLGDPVSTSVTFLKTNYRVCLDVPELEDLEIFDHRGCPHMFIFLPGSKEMLKVTFHCRRCGEDGHTQQDCPRQSLDNKSRTNNCREVPNSSNIRHSFTFDPVNRDDGAHSDEYSSSTSSNIQGVSPLSSRNAAGTPSSRNSTSSAVRSPYFSYEDTSTPSTCSTITADEAGPVPNFGNDLESSDFCRSFLAEAVLSPQTAVEDTKILSPLLQSCINEACKESNVMDRNHLDAFLVHVKSKSHPVKVAKIFTSDVGGVKRLLQRIITLIYHSPEKPGAQDKAFIKWLQGVVERF